ncbi:MAG: glutathione S-transferase family protein [Pseudomonadota bacterium]
MLKLMTFGPAFGLADPSPFCLKAMILLKMAGLPFETEVGDVRKMPKGKIPVLVNSNGQMVPDTTLMRFHLETEHGVDFDVGLSPAERGAAWAFEKLCEDQLYFATVHERWLIDANFDAGPRSFFDAVPAPMRPLVIMMVRKQVKRDLHGHGLGRHSRDEIVTIANRGFDAISAYLGDKPWLMGETPCGADASVWSAVAAAAVECFDSAITRHVNATSNLVAYRDRGLAHWFGSEAATGQADAA